MIVVAAAAGVGTWWRTTHWSHSPTASPFGQQPRLAGTPTSPVTPVSPVIPASPVSALPPADPFLGSPAESWANGASGIIIPAAKPVGGFTAAQVSTAYRVTSRLLIAADLDKQTLLGGAPTAFADLLTNQQRADFLSGLNKKGLDSRGFPVSSRQLVASFFPGSVKLLGNVIKVRGVMNAHTTRESGSTVLAIQVSYIFVYPIESPGTPSDWMRVVDDQHGSFEFAQWDDPGGPLEPWDQTVIDNAGIQCGTTDGYIHPDYPSERERLGAPTPSGPVINPYAPPPTSTPGTAVCQRTSGT